MKTTIYLLLFLFFLTANCNKGQENKIESDSDIDLIAMVKLNGKYGYINTNGEFVIEPKYKLARSFSNGLASVNINGMKVDAISGVIGGSYAFIDVNDKIAFNGKTFNEPMYFFNEYSKAFISNYNFGYFNKKGDLVKDKFSFLFDFNNGLAKAIKNEEHKNGFIDYDGNWVLQYEIENFRVEDFSEGLAKVFVRESTGKYSSDWKWGYINKTGDFVIEPKYKECSNFKEGLAIVQEKTKFNVGYKKEIHGYKVINKLGEVIIDATSYDDIYSFSEGLAAVKKNDKWGFIDNKGQEIIELKYDDVGTFKNGLATYRTEKNKIGFLLKSGKKAFDTEFDNATNFENGYSIFKGNNGKLGFINTKGQVVIEPKYDRAGNFVNPNENNIDKTANL